MFIYYLNVKLKDYYEITIHLFLQALVFRNVNHKTNESQNARVNKTLNCSFDDRSTINYKKRKFKATHNISWYKTFKSKVIFTTLY